MHLLKFSTLYILFIFSSFSFTDEECFNSSFEETVKHKTWPFGLSENVIKVRKEGCELAFFHEKLKYIKSHWLVDTCREPIHIKMGVGNVDVIKKTRNCTVKEGSGNTFCTEVLKLRTIIQDDGLIFAKGVKSKLNSAHGKIYCTYKLLNYYVSGQVFSTDYYIAKKEKVEKISEVKSEESLAPRPIVEGSEVMENQVESKPAEEQGSSAKATGSF